LKFHGKELRRQHTKDSGQYVVNEPGITLDKVLEENKLTTKDRAILAYILARSVWQYYGSDWTQTRWTADSILFMKENLDNVMPPDINATIPYFVLQDPDQRNNGIQIQEYFDNFDTTHKYPLVLTLGMLLVDVCRKGGTTNQVDESSSLVKRINTERALYYRMATREKDWPHMNTSTESKNTYKTIVLKCLEDKIFKDALSLEERRDLIFKNIVFPLKQLLVDLKWIDCSGNIITSNSNPEEGGVKIPTETSEPLDLTENEIWLV
jgi:hypothetical protein